MRTIHVYEIAEDRPYPAPPLPGERLASWEIADWNMALDSGHMTLRIPADFPFPPDAVPVVLFTDRDKYVGVGTLDAHGLHSRALRAGDTPYFRITTVATPTPAAC